MPVVVDVRPSAFTDAAHIVGAIVAERVRTVWEALEAGLARSSGMAGSDDIGVEWGDAYDGAAAAAARATQDVCNACYQLAALLEQTGANYAAAERSSIPGADPWLASALWAGTRVGLPGVTSALGIGMPSPMGWSLLQHAIGYLWPNGHQDRLRSAAQVWNGAAGRLDESLPVLGRAARAVLLQRAPESDDAFTVVDAMTGHVAALADAYRGLGSSCSAYAEHLDRAHHEILGELTSFLEWTAGIQVAGGFFAAVTFGISEALAQTAEAAEVLRAANAIRAAIEVLQAVARDERVVAEVAGADAATVTSKVAPVLARDVAVARVEQVADVATMGERNLAVAGTPEQAALAELETATTRPVLKVSRRQIEDKFEHAPAFGVIAARGRDGFIAFEGAVRAFVQDPATKHVFGRYLGDDVLLSYSVESRLVVMQSPTGQFISGWKMGEKQLGYVERLAVLGGH